MICVEINYNTNIANISIPEKLRATIIQNVHGHGFENDMFYVEAITKNDVVKIQKVFFSPKIKTVLHIIHKGD